MIRKSVTLVISVLLVGALALPASAGVELGVVAFNVGGIKIGEAISTEDVPQDGVCTPTGKGLHFVGFGGPTKTQDKFANRIQLNKTFFYHLSSAAVNALALHTNDPSDTVVTSSGVLNVCGRVLPGPFGIGAAAGSSTGADGHGKLDLISSVGTAVRHYTLSHVGWVPTFGGVLPVYGQIQRNEDTGGKGKHADVSQAPFFGLVQASPTNTAAGAADKPTSATDYTARGVVAAVALGKE